MPEYLIYSRDAEGSVGERVFEASSGEDARSMAQAVGLEVVAVEVLGSSRGAVDDDSSDPFSSPASDDPRKRPEESVWKGSPSQWVNAGWFALGLLVVTLPVTIAKALGTAMTVYEVTTQRIKYRHGVISQSIDEIELYRVKDTELRRSLADRVLGLGTITVISSDETTPRLEMKGIADAEGVREIIRENVEAVRRARGVRELDVS